MIFTKDKTVEGKLLSFTNSNVDGDLILKNQ